MHEHNSRRILDGTQNFKSKSNAAGAVKTWIQRRIFRTVNLGIFVTGIAIFGGFHGRFVQADQQPTLSTATLNQDAAALREVLPTTKAATQTSSLTSPTKPLSSSVKAASVPDIYEKVEKRQELIPFSKVIHLSKNEPAGEARIAKSGSNGLLEKTYQITYKGETAIKFVLQSQKTVKPKSDMVVIAGYSDREARALPSRSGMYTRTQEIDMVATGYSPYEGSGCGRCANGMRAGFGVVAVDPRLIPLGSKLYIDGYGYAVAGDTGGAIKGRRIDLGMNTYRTANQVGRRLVHVYVMSDSR